MPRRRPLHLHHERTRHGELVWYVRIDKGPHIRIRETYGTPEFDTAYRAAISGGAPTTSDTRGASAGTMEWPVTRYRDSQKWAALSPATRRLRERMYQRLVEVGGHRPCCAVRPEDITKALDAQKATPFQAAKWLDAMRALFAWALDAKHIIADPTSGVRAKTPRSDGFKPWTEDEVARFEAHWPIRTRERLAFDLLQFTGLRRGEVARLGRQHVLDGVISIRTEKTGQLVTLPVLPALAATIDATPVGDLAFTVTCRNQPMVKEGFGNWFRDVCNAAGVSGSAHGLRKLGATRAADNGATEAELEAIFGWRGGGMASLYTREANRKKLAKGAMAKMAPMESDPDGYSRTLLPGAGRNGKNCAKTMVEEECWWRR